MGIGHLLDHLCRVWRPVEGLDQFRAVVNTYEVVGSFPCGVRRPRAPLGNPGPGLTPVGERIVYMTPERDVKPRDVIELLSGPDAPGRFEIDEPPTRPRGHHLELRCRHFAGVLPEDGAS